MSPPSYLFVLVCSSMDLGLRLNQKTGGAGKETTCEPRRAGLERNNHCALPAPPSKILRLGVVQWVPGLLGPKPFRSGTPRPKSINFSGTPRPGVLGPVIKLLYLWNIMEINVHLTKFPTLPVIFSIYLKTDFSDFFEIL